MKSTTPLRTRQKGRDAMTRLRFALLVLIALLAVSAGLAASTAAAQVTIDPRVLEDTANGTTGRFLVLLSQQAHPRPPVGDRAAQGRAILDALRSVAASEGVIISAGQEGKTKTALQMIGIIVLLSGYPYQLSYAGIDLGIVDLEKVGRALVYLSLVFSVASAAQYLSLFSEAVEAKEEKLRSDESTRSL